MKTWIDRSAGLFKQISWYRGVLSRNYSYVTNLACEREIKRLDSKLARLLKPHLSEVTVAGEITQSDIDKARQADITTLFPESNGGMVKCLFHEDGRPSASIKKGFLKCFSCNKRADVIECYMKLHSCSFVEAVKRLK